MIPNESEAMRREEMLKTLRQVAARTQKNAFAPADAKLAAIETLNFLESLHREAGAIRQSMENCQNVIKADRAGAVSGM